MGLSRCSATKVHLSMRSVKRDLIHSQKRPTWHLHTTQLDQRHMKRRRWPGMRSVKRDLIHSQKRPTYHSTRPTTHEPLGTETFPQEPSQGPRRARRRLCHALRLTEGAGVQRLGVCKKKLTKFSKSECPKSLTIKQLNNTITLQYNYSL
jgi:hypothetical protein